MHPQLAHHQDTEDTGEPFYGYGRPLTVRGVGPSLVRRLASEVRAGVPTAIAVIGPRGAGRTTFLRRAAAFASASGVTVLTGRGSPSEQQSTCGVALQLASALPDAERPADLEQALTAPPRRSVLVEGFSQALLRAARRRPLALAVDDVQWADPHSLDVLCAVLRRMRSTRLTVMISMTGTAPDVPASCTELLTLVCSPPVRGHVVRLDPPPPPAVPAQRTAQLARSRRTGAAPRPRGNGLPTRQRPRPGSTPPTAAPDRTADLTWGMAPEPLALLRGMAACRDLLPVPLVSALVGLEETSTVSALRALRAAGLVTSDQPPRLTGLVNPERVLSAMDDADRQALYEQAAELGHQAALQDEALADLLLRARPSGAPWVSGTLRRVAAACRARGEHRRAVRCLARALQEPLPADEHARLLVELGTAGCLTDPDAADRFLVQALHGTGRHGGTWNRPTAADLLLARGDAVAARHALAAAYPAARDDEQERAALLALHWFAENARLDESGLEGILSDMPALPAVPQDPSGLAAAAWQAATVGQDAARARNLGLAALDFPLRGLPLYPRLFACRALGVTDEVDAAHTGLSAALAEARRRQMPPLVGLALLFSCELHLRCGDIGRAARDLAMARIEMPISAWHPTMAPAVQALEVRIRVARDQLDAAENIAYLDCPVGGEQRYSWPQLLFARGVLRLAQGRPQEAAAELRECGRWLLARGWTSPGLMAWRPVRAIAHACSGESAEAARLLAEEQRLAARWATPSALGTVDLISGLLAEGDPAVRLLECAVQRLRVSPAADLYVLALAQLASARDRLGERDSSCSLQAEAAQLAAGLGHTLMHDRLRTDR